MNIKMIDSNVNIIIFFISIRNPRYAFVAKQLMEPERFIQFRVAWMDDVGVVRLNR